MVKKFYRALVFLSIVTIFQGTFSQNRVIPTKIIALSDSDVISIRQDLAIAKKILHFLWKKDISNKFLMMTPLLIVLFEKKISVEELISRYQFLAPYKNKLYKLISLTESIQGTLDLLKELKKQGVLLVLASDYAEDIVEYNKTKKPEIFNLFDSTYNDAENKLKHDTAFYNGLRKAINDFACVTHATEILFVDSNKSHTDAAQKADLNISSHLFLGSEEFKKDLIQRGYLL